MKTKNKDISSLNQIHNLHLAGKKEQKTLLKYIDNCYVTEEEKEEMEEFMLEIWGK